MNDTTRTTIRRILLVLGLALLVGMAGCSGILGDDSDGQTSPEPTATETPIPRPTMPEPTATPTPVAQGEFENASQPLASSLQNPDRYDRIVTIGIRTAYDTDRSFERPIRVAAARWNRHSEVSNESVGYVVKPDASNPDLEVVLDSNIFRSGCTEHFDFDYEDYAEAPNDPDMKKPYLEIEDGSQFGTTDARVIGPQSRSSGYRLCSIPQTDQLRLAGPYNDTSLSVIAAHGLGHMRLINNTEQHLDIPDIHDVHGLHSAFPGNETVVVAVKTHQSALVENYTRDEYIDRVTQTTQFWEKVSPHYGVWDGNYVVDPDAPNPDVVVHFVEEVSNHCKYPTGNQKGCISSVGNTIYTPQDTPVTIYLEPWERLQDSTRHEFAHLHGIRHGNTMKFVGCIRYPEATYPTSCNRIYQSGEN